MKKILSILLIIAMLSSLLAGCKTIDKTDPDSSSGPDTVQSDKSDPDKDKNANTFAPTTENVGHPQSRVLESLTNTSVHLLCSSSEYSKFAHHYLPGADKNGITHCKEYKGSVSGILGWYADNVKYVTTADIDGYEWSLTPRGIPGIGVEDIRLATDSGQVWVPQEYNPHAQEGE